MVIERQHLALALVFVGAFRYAAWPGYEDSAVGARGRVPIIAGRFEQLHPIPVHPGQGTSLLSRYCTSVPVADLEKLAGADHRAVADVAFIANRVACGFCHHPASGNDLALCMTDKRRDCVRASLGRGPGERVRSFP